MDRGLHVVRATDPNENAFEVRIERFRFRPAGTVPNPPHLLPQVSLAQKKKTKTTRTTSMSTRTIKLVVKPPRTTRMFKRGSDKSSEVAEDARIVETSDVVVLFARAVGLRLSRLGKNIQMETDPMEFDKVIG